ncbi:VacJ family lipoprotein [Acinetobacter sp. 194]|uniref:MlaA family lipoprotein n=1 Tax=Acinetobacter shaoyimingii TaxID=2715164 RepID=UPI00140A82BE|nr:VacJ family lipoprotein [Acinetobacter shaoyimingii]NHB59546.1 VacJ family lipoprotein [Acinetobacter shaoyimingii]
MRRINLLWASMFIAGLSAHVSAQTSDKAYIENSSIENNSPSNNLGTKTEQNATSSEALTIDDDKSVRHPRLEALKELKGIKIDDLKVNATAAQEDHVKDPLQPLNRQIYDLNDYIDQKFARPVALQYKAKVPSDVRGSYRGFRKNMGEPWNAVNQAAQGRFVRAVKSLGRFTLNTVTTLGLADPASRLGLETEEESLGTTLGYYGVPSGPYLMLPVLGPSTFRDGFGRIVDSQGRLQKYVFQKDRVYYGDYLAGGIDSRAQLLDVEDVLQGDKYAALRDIYLQRKAFEIAEKKGVQQDSDLFINDDLDETATADPQ